ncbi:hypothetical protein BDR07DRAFT_1425952 [Suillus spraguei]|nr:hypothetical protein BDR07DRAFT_1425952 [Suillus spraguei]
MKAEFTGWEPHMPSTLNWKLIDHDPLETCIHKGRETVSFGRFLSPHPRKSHYSRLILIRLGSHIILKGLQ